MAEQVGLDAVLVSWTAPVILGGYRVTAEPGGVSATVSSSPYTLRSLRPGMYNISVIALSNPSEPVGLVEVTVRGEGN